MKKNRLALLTVGLVLVAVAVLTLSGSIGAEGKAAAFLEAVRQGRIGEAYAMTAPEYRKLVDREQFADLVKGLRLAKTVSVGWDAPAVAQPRTLRGKLRFGNGSQLPFELAFVDRPSLMISGLGSPRAVPVGRIPTGAAARRLVDQTLTDVALDEEQQQFATLYQRASQQLRGAQTLEQLAARLEKVRQHRAARHALQRGTFTNAPRPRLNLTGEITFRGQRETPLVRADYELRYLYEGAGWRVSALDVSALCRAQVHAEQFLNSIGDGQFARAYAETSQRLRRGSVSEFRSYVEGMQLAKLRGVRWDPDFRVLGRDGKASDAPYVVLSTATVKTATGRVRIRVRSVGGGENWKIDAFGDVYPGVEERHAMIRESLLRLGRGVGAGEFSEFHRAASQAFQKQNPLAELRRKFAVLIQRKIDLASIADHDPVASETPVMRGKTLEVSGIFHTNQIELTYRLQYVLESAAWKLDEMDLEYNAGAMARTEQFLSNMRAERREAAYQQTASSFRKEVTLQELTDVVGRLGLDGFVSADWESLHVRNNQALLLGTVRVDDGGRFLLKVGLLREDGEWRVANFNKSRGSLRAPPESDVRQLIARSLRELSRAIAEDDFRIIIKNSARLLKRATSATALRGGFKQLSKSGLDLEAVAGLDAQLERLDIDNNGLLQVAGFISTPPSRLRFNLNYDFEGDQWKLAEIKVRWVSASELAARQFLHLVAAGDMDAAYAMTAESMQQQESQAKLSQRMSQIGLDRYDSVRWTAHKIGAKQSELEGQVQLFDGIDFYVKVVLQSAGTEWRVASVDKCRGPLMVPDAAELSQRILNTLLPLQQAIASDDFETWRDQTSVWMQSLKSAQQIRQELKPLTDRKLNLSSLKRQPPKLIGQATVDSAGRLTVKVHCDVQPQPIVAELVYTFESEWKLLQFKLTFVDPPPR